MQKKAVLVILFAWFFVLLAGLTSELYLGDESYHYRFAKDFYNLGKRPVFDSVYGTGEPPGYFYSSEPLWPFILSKIWKTVGKISFPIAQAYHSMYFLFLLVFTYLAAKTLYSEKEAFYSLILLAACPVVLAFGIIFYLDIPVTMFCVLAFLLILKGRYFWAGISLGLTYLTKRNGLFILPGIFLIILLLPKSRLIEKMKNLSILSFAMAILIIPDLAWREFSYRNYNLEHTATSEQTLEVFAASGITDRIISPPTQLANTWKGSLTHRSLDTPQFLSPLDLLKYLGLSLLLLIGLYFIQRKYRKTDLFLWLPLGSFFLLFIYFLGPFADVRYILPTIPFLVILSSKTFFSFRRDSLRILLLGVCIAQLFSTLAYVNIKRHIPADTKAAFDFIKKDTPRDANVFYPGQILLEATDRKVIWSRFGLQINKLFWPGDADEFKNAIRTMKLDYIVIDQKRIYDDTNIHHLGGYPKSFVEKLPTRKFLKLVFENSSIKIFKVGI